MPTLTDEQLAALREWYEAETAVRPRVVAIDAILADNPAPEPPWEPFTGVVVDAGGGNVLVLVDRDTQTYPNHGDEVTVRPRRLVQEFTDELAAAFWRALFGSPTEELPHVVRWGHEYLARLKAARITVTFEGEA